MKRYKVISRVASAADCIGRLCEGDEITGLTCGQFSAIDILEHMLDELGPADVCMSTWTSGIYDIEKSAQLKARGDIKTARVLLDKANFFKSPQYAGPLIDALGVDSFRDTNTHAKIIIVEGDGGAAVMRSSMNLNKNLKTEQFDISVCMETVRFYRQWFDGIWENAAPKANAENVFRAVYDRYEVLRGDVKNKDAPQMSSLVAMLRGAA